MGDVYFQFCKQCGEGFGDYSLLEERALHVLTRHQYQRHGGDPVPTCEAVNPSGTRCGAATSRTYQGTPMCSACMARYGVREPMLYDIGQAGPEDKLIAENEHG